MQDKRDLGPATETMPRPWWEHRAFVVAMILMASIPLLFPTIPPLVDLPGHMGRYRVQLDLAVSPELRQYYTFQWALIGNLGVDLLVVPLSKLFGLELAVKLIVLAIPPLTVAGFLWVAREVHGRLPPTALFVLPFAFGHPFLFGFVNFTLAMAFAFLAFGLWLRLAKLGRFRLRALLFVPISCLVWLTHMFGWGALGLMCFSAEAVRQHDRGRGWMTAGWRAALQCLVLLLPLVPTLAWRSDSGGAPTIDWFNWTAKWRWLRMALRDRWEWFDLAMIAGAGLLLIFAIFHRRMTFSRHLGFSALVLIIAFAIMPRVVFGSAFADMRLIPYAVAVLVLAIRFRDRMPPVLARNLAVAGLLFAVAKVAATTASLAIAAKDQDRRLVALDYLPRGAAMVSLVGQACDQSWPLFRNSHLPAMAIVRNHAFSNDQWMIAGANLMNTRLTAAGRYARDPSQMVRPAQCSSRDAVAVDRAMAAIPRDVFDYVWLIDIPPYDPRSLAGYRLIWSGQGSQVYAIGDRRGKEAQ
jgi:hypothetical protein